MNKININKVAVIGSGIMGSRIACHLANVNINVILLDISPKELSAQEKKLNKKITDKSVRNRIVNESLQKAIKSKPSPIFKKDVLDKIKTGNIDEDLHLVSNVDWIIEAVVENLDIKNKIYDEIENYRKKTTLISTNTSGIPISQISEGRSENFKKNFLGTHFFNPPRYLKLLEIIPGEKTHKDIIDYFMKFGSLVLGKDTVLCKDTPAFIANRLGIYSLMSTIHSVEKYKLSISEVDFLTGPLIGRPKSATFRTMDVVGLDTAVNVSNNLLKDLKNDESVSMFKLPDSVKKLYNNKQWGDKTGMGFYKKEVDEKGNKTFYQINTKTDKYETYENLNATHHYETKEIKNSLDVIIVPEKLECESDYSVTYFDSNVGREVTVLSADCTTEVTNYTYEERIEDAKRNIYLLKPQYLGVIKDDMEIAMPYKKGSTQYLSETLKLAENIKLYQ